MWRIIKFFNKRLNEMLCVRMKVLIWAGMFPISGLPRINGDRIVLPYYFVGRDDWGSTTNLYGSAFDAPFVVYDGGVRIRTERGLCWGRDWSGKWFERGFSSGKVQFRGVPRGSVHTFFAGFDRGGLGSWDAIWLLGDGDRYREVDIERMFTKGKSPREVVISVHDGESSEVGRRLYNHQYILPGGVVQFTIRLGYFTRVYVNGILVFVGLQFRFRGGMFIVNSGIISAAVDYAADSIFQVSDIRHYKR